MEKTIRAANILFKQMPESRDDERGGDNYEVGKRGTGDANWGMWPMKAWPEEIKGKRDQKDVGAKEAFSTESARDFTMPSG